MVKLHFNFYLPDIMPLANGNGIPFDIMPLANGNGIPFDISLSIFYKIPTYLGTSLNILSFTV